MGWGPLALFAFDLVFTGVVIMAGVQLGRLYRHFRPAGGGSDGGPPWRYAPQPPPGPDARPARRAPTRPRGGPATRAVRSRSRR